jgi:SAM-dependent methyltransferase
MVADWQLPPGVSRGLWEYVNDPAIARQYDASLADTPLLSWDIDFVREHCRPPGRILDLGCGTGRLSIALAREGYQCLAVDLSEEMLTIVGEGARAANVRIDCAKMNAVDLRALADGSFDYVACLFQTLGMIAGDAQRREVVRHAARILRPGGIFVLHAHNRWFHLGTRHGRRLLRRNLIRSLLGREAAGDFLMPPHQGIGPMPMHLFTRREIGRLLASGGLEVVEVRRVAVDARRLPLAWFFPEWRAYGYLVAACKAPMLPV